MKKIRILGCIFIILTIIIFNWNVLTDEQSDEFSIYQLLLCFLGIVFTVFICISDLLNWKETRPVLVRVIEGIGFALFGIIMALAAWNIFTTKDDIAMSSFAATLALGSIVLSLSSYFNWKKDRPKLYTNISIIMCVLILISFLAIFILRIMSMRPVE
jgi:hypothetical protein